MPKNQMTLRIHPQVENSYTSGLNSKVVLMKPITIKIILHSKKITLILPRNTTIFFIFIYSQLYEGGSKTLKC